MVDYSKWDNLDVSDSDEETQKTTSKKAAAVSNKSTSSTSQALTTTTTSSGTQNKESHEDPPTQEEEEEEHQPRLSPTLQQFANIHPSNYRASHEYLTTHPELIDKSTNSDGILMKEAFLLALQLENTPEDDKIHAAQIKSGEMKPEERQSESERGEIVEMVRQCVHQALLLQYCRLVSPDGRDQSAIGGFFMRLIMPEGYGGGSDGKGKEKEKEDGNGRQRELLINDVETRAKEIIELAREARVEQLREHLKKIGQ